MLRFNGVGERCLRAYSFPGLYDSDKRGEHVDMVLSYITFSPTFKDSTSDYFNSALPCHCLHVALLRGLNK